MKVKDKSNITEEHAKAHGTGNGFIFPLERISIPFWRTAPPPGTTILREGQNHPAKTGFPGKM
jgi:hypothetical protein